MEGVSSRNETEVFKAEEFTLLWQRNKLQFFLTY